VFSIAEGHLLGAAGVPYRVGREEFTDTHHILMQIYVREARRMVEMRLYTEADTRANFIKVRRPIRFPMASLLRSRFATDSFERPAVQGNSLQRSSIVLGY